MARFAVGQMVKLVSHAPDPYVPPIGAIGTVLRVADGYGDYAVLFHAYPWNPAHGLPLDNPLEGNDWEVPGCQLAPLADVPESISCTTVFPSEVKHDR